MDGELMYSSDGAVKAHTYYGVLAQSPDPHSRRGTFLATVRVNKSLCDCSVPDLASTRVTSGV